MRLSYWSSDVCSSDLEQVRMRLLDLIEQQHAVRMLVDRVGEEAALVVADIARGRADQAAHRMALHVFGHVEALERNAHDRGELTRHLGLADAGGAREEIVADRLRSEEHTSELPSLMRSPSAVFCLKK